MTGARSRNSWSRWSNRGSLSFLKEMKLNLGKFKILLCNNFCRVFNFNLYLVPALPAANVKKLSKDQQDFYCLCWAIIK